MAIEKKNSYRNILKGTAIFGGVQVFNIIINLVRGKLVAMILGPEGMGISSLLTTASTTIQQATSLGINSSAVRNISNSNENDTPQETSHLIKAVRRITFLTSLSGAILTIFFSKWLSQITFGNNDYQWAFILLSLFIFFSTLTNGESCILQGFRKLKSLALRSTIGPICGLVIGIPLYYWKGYDGIVPAMITIAIISFLFVRYGTLKIQINKIHQSWKQTWTIGKSIIALGIIMMIAVFIGNLSTYSLNSFIRSFGSLTDVGLFQAANSITNQYTGLIFAAMAMDYYPRLATVIQDNIKLKEYVNQQAEMVLLVVVPIATIIIITAPIIIQILLTDQFYTILPIMRFMGLGVIFKAICFPLGYISVAKGDKTYYFCTEGIYVNIKTFLIHAIFYYYWGVYGLGIASLTSSIIDILVSSLLTKWRYNITFSTSFLKLCIYLIPMAVLCFCCSFIDNAYLSYGVMTFCACCICIYSFIELNKRILIKDLFLKKLKNK